MNLAVFAGLAAVSLMVAVYKVQFMLIYPSNFPEGSREVVDRPDEYDMEFDDVEQLTPDGEKIHLYVIPRAGATKTVLFMGPNAGNMGNGLPFARFVHDMGHNVVLLSYRGYGKSTGSASEKGLKIDAATTLRFIQEHEVLGSTKVVIYGRSLGGAVAIYSAAMAPPGSIAGVILENTFLSIPKVAPAVFSAFKFVSPLISERWESEKAIRRIAPELPMLFMAGGSDELIPPSQFRQLYELCPSEHKEYNLYPRGNHNDTVIQRGYWDDFAAFVKKL